MHSCIHTQNKPIYTSLKVQIYSSTQPCYVGQNIHQIITQVKLSRKCQTNRLIFLNRKNSRNGTLRKALEKKKWWWKPGNQGWMREVMAWLVCKTQCQMTVEQWLWKLWWGNANQTQEFYTEPSCLLRIQARDKSLRQAHGI